MRGRPKEMVHRKAAYMLSFSLVFVMLTTNRALSAEPAVEKWADPALKIINGMMLWLDAGRQNLARTPYSKPALWSGGPIDVWYDASGHGMHLVQQFQT